MKNFENAKSSRSIHCDMSYHMFQCGKERVNFWIKLRINAYFWIISCLTFWLGQSKSFGIYNEFNGRNPINNFIQATGSFTISACDVAIWLCGYFFLFNYINQRIWISTLIRVWMRRICFTFAHNSANNSEKTKFIYMKNVQILIGSIFHWDLSDVSIENFLTVFYRW